MENEYNKIFKFLNIEELYNMNYTEERVGIYSEKIKTEIYNKLINFFKKDTKKLEKLLGYSTNWF